MNLDKLRKYCQEHKGKDKIVVVVCYPMDYAVEVHERTDKRHRVGQSKYLESAALELTPQIIQMIRSSTPNTLPETLMRCGLLIQRESQLRVPVDTSALKSSAFTVFEEELDTEAMEARSRAEVVRIKVLKRRDRQARSSK